MIKEIEVLTPERQLQLWDKLHVIIDKYLINNSNYANINRMLTALQDKFVSAPASTKYHGCYIGGLLEHTIDTIEAAILVYEYLKLGGRKTLPSIESVVIAALFHDIGKIGDLNSDYYIVEKSEWHIRNLGRRFDINKDLDNVFLEHQHGSIFLVNQFNITLTKDEFQAILLHADMYNTDSHYIFRDLSVLTHIIQIADHISSTLRSSLLGDGSKSEENK